MRMYMGHAGCLMEFLARELDDPAAAPKGPCLLVDDMVDSRWTFTVAAAVLRQAGCGAVFPLALALNSPRMD